MTPVEIERLKDAYGGHWGEHPDHPLQQWQDEAFDSLTRLGYWEWAFARMSQ